MCSMSKINYWFIFPSEISCLVISDTGANTELVFIPVAGCGGHHQDVSLCAYMQNQLCICQSLYVLNEL